MQLVDQLLNRRLVTFQMPFNTSVRSIAHPAHDSESPRPLGRPSTEENALDQAADTYLKSDLGHQTTLISGASSAFMPTTL